MTPPKKPKKICRMPHCHKKTHDTYCDDHKKDKRSGWKPKKKTHPFYNHKAWRGNIHKPLGQRGGLRERKLMETPYCESCYDRTGVHKDVTGPDMGVVDHIEPWRRAETEAEQWELFTDFDNLQTLCKACHARKTGRGK